MKSIEIDHGLMVAIQSGKRLLKVDDLPTVPSNQFVYLKSKSDQYLAYFSMQNKGIGWVVDGQDFVALFQRAKDRRRAYSQDSLTTAFRIFNQDGDGFGGISIDLYGHYGLVSWYNDFVYQLKSEVIAALTAVFPEIKGIYGKNRFDSALEQSEHLWGQPAPAQFNVLENGVNYQVFMDAGLMTGIFLDQKEVRASLVEGLASGCRVLNTFSYTAAFSVAAAMGGASETVSVDLAKRSLSLSQANFKANQLDLAHHRFHVMDIFDYFKYAKRKGLSFDVIILDPPSFARNKKQTFSVAKDYDKLLAEAASLLTDEGLIIASTNAQNLSNKAFDRLIDQGLSGYRYQTEASYHLPGDFLVGDPESDYLKVKFLRLC